jgi:type IV pilus assembly protein PilW
MKLKNTRYNKNKGMSLIELLIAMLIGSLMMVGVVTLFSSNKRIYKEQNSMGRLQENARFAIEILIKDIRMAGYAGCADSISSVTNNLNNSTNDDNLYNFENAIEGSESKANWQPSNSNDQVASIAANTDAITIRYMQPSGITIDNPYSPPTSSSLFVNDGSTLSDGDIVAITDCSDADIFQITNDPSNNPTPPKDTVVHNAGAQPTGPGNAGGGISKTYGADAQFLVMVNRRYYIADADGDGISGLYRIENTETVGTEMIEGVERMEILYGEDTNLDTVADRYVDAATVGATNWDNVVSVQIALLFMTVDQDFTGDENTNTYTLLNSAAYDPNPNDYRRRRIVSNTVQIRNRSN